MTGSAKRQTLIFLGLVMIITVIIAASLPQLDLQPGMPLPSVEKSELVIPPGELQLSPTYQISPFVMVLLALICAELVLFLIYKMARSIGWVNVQPFIQPIMVILLIAGSIVFLIFLAPKTLDTPAMELPIPTEKPVITSPLGPVPTVLLWLVGIGLLVSSIILGIRIFAPSSTQKTTIDLVGLEAEKAWQALMTGLELKDVIVNCYRQMSLVLEKEQGIERKDFMTTREFENLLETAGIPHDPIYQLTQLFEAVRYGNWQPNQMDEQKAINSLEAIMLYSRDLKKKG